MENSLIIKWENIWIPSSITSGLVGTMGRFSNRLPYERELIQIIESKSNFFGQRGTHSLGCDVLFLRSSGLDTYMFCFWGEVKSSKSHKINFSAKLREQYDNYINLWNDRKIITYYFFRIITSKTFYEYKDSNKEIAVKKLRHGHKEDKWRVFRITDVPKTRNNNPYLDFFNEKAMTIDEFLEVFP